MSHEAIIVAGPNGAGKSTLAYEFQAGTDYPYISADLIAAELSPADPLKARVAAGRMFATEVAGFTERAESFIAETTLSGRAFTGVMRRLREKGFEITIAFVFLNTPELCIRRVRQRVMKGGHDVPEEDIRRRFVRSKENFWTVYRPLADRWHLYYNAGQSFQEVALGDPESETVVDETLFSHFKQDIS